MNDELLSFDWSIMVKLFKNVYGKCSKFSEKQKEGKFVVKIDLLENVVSDENCTNLVRWYWLAGQSGKTNHFELHYLSPQLQLKQQPCLNDREKQLWDKRILQKLA